ncbi:magnesium transporter [Scopulibacillus daqui]|uniref:Magnesium transporter n=1 Tax=Scopulibacillus daqui TaxID=1469162 RepID=A0ABS2PZ37_9BACL|nr:magnesium transporter CorA family protein [Scopulibacillus daqui]MBM7644980.1 magnesium transporter [Scopulibacillus daqui]
MLSIYLTDEHGKLNEVNELTKGCWINLTSPTAEEIKYVVDHAEIPEDFIRDPLDDDERSRIEKEDQNVLTIVDIPVKVNDETDSALYDTIPIGIIVTPFYFVTVCLQENPIINRFTQNKVKGFFTYKKTRFTLQILYMISVYYLNYLRRIDRKTTEIEYELSQAMKNKELFNLLSLQKTLVYFTTSLKANNIVMEKMLKQHFLRMYEDDQDLLEDVIIENKQAIEMTEVYSKVLNGMMDTYASVINNNVNFVMKFLTAITIVLTIPTMVASFYGMNVHIPFQNSPHAIWFPLLISFTLSFVIVVIFWKKKYF